MIWCKYYLIFTICFYASVEYLVSFCKCKMLSPTRKGLFCAHQYTDMQPMQNNRYRQTTGGTHNLWLHIAFTRGKKVREADTCPKPEPRQSRGAGVRTTQQTATTMMRGGMQEEDACTCERQRAISLHMSARYEHK